VSAEAATTDGPQKHLQEAEPHKALPPLINSSRDLQIRDYPTPRQSTLDLGDMDRELTPRIVLERPPGGVDFGLQKGRGSAYETVQTQRSEGSDLSFEFSVHVKACGYRKLRPD
jgi:hypothetical protein